MSQFYCSTSREFRGIIFSLVHLFYLVFVISSAPSQVVSHQPIPPLYLPPCLVHRFSIPRLSSLATVVQSPDHFCCYLFLFVEHGSSQVVGHQSIPPLCHLLSLLHRFSLPHFSGLATVVQSDYLLTVSVVVFFFRAWFFSGRWSPTHPTSFSSLVSCAQI